MTKQVPQIPCSICNELIPFNQIDVHQAKAHGIVNEKYKFIEKLQSQTEKPGDITQKHHKKIFMCKHCGAFVEELESHLIEKHDWVRCEHCKSLLDRVHYPKHMKMHKTRDQLNHKRIKRIKIYSKRGTRIYSEGNCDLCCRPAKQLWRYTKTNIGLINICDSCKKKLRPPPDLLDRAILTAFETNPRKH